MTDQATDRANVRCDYHVFDRSLLRAYDIRGVYGVTLHARDAYAVGRSFATVVRRRGGSRVAVGRDGRLSSPTLAAALITGLSHGGVMVRDVGLVPTPVLYYAVASAPEVHGGIEVTGSHNPADHNGFKMDLGGQPFFGDDILDLGRIAAAGDWTVNAGNVAEIEQVALDHAYCTRILAALDGIDPAHIAGLRIGWDTGNGAAGPLVERLTRALPGQHRLFHTCVDGHFPHHHPDPSDTKNLCDLVAAVADGSIDFGFAFDGDGDRLGVVDGRGRVVWGDQILLMLARDLLQRRPGALILADVKASQAVFDGIAALGGIAQMAPTGHSLIKSAMKQTGAVLAGELTGHLFFADDYYGYDDALYGALRLIAASVRLGETITQMRDAIPATFATPDLRFAVPGIDPFAAIARLVALFRDAGNAFDATDCARVRTPDGWWLLRASNTEAMLTARAESMTEAGLVRTLADMDGWLARLGVSRS